jgi:predicted porin
MQKKLLAVAVAGALVAPAAMAQSSVTISGALNLWYESAGASGASNASTATATTFDVKRRDRIQDGAGSNIRFTVVEDLGSGMSAFGQVESAVFNNADTRATNYGAGGPAATVGGWANRNSGVGLRGKAWGEFLLGIWDTHYNESYAVDNQLLTGPSHSSSLALLNTFGTPGNGSTALNPTVGGRLGNVLRYASPNWGGFHFNAAYSRPSDGLVSTAAAGGTALPIEGKKNTVWNFAPKYTAGPIHIGYSYMQDKDGVSTPTAAPFAGAAIGGTATPAGSASTATVSLNKITSNRLQGAYTAPFGLKVGLIWDRSKLDSVGNVATAPSSKIERDVWSLPISFTSGAHSGFFTWARARNWKGNIGGVDLGSITVTPGGPGATAQNLGSNTGARFLSLGYQYALSKRTNVHVNYSDIRNDSLAGYDFFANPVGMANGNFGADPKVYSIGLRHAF